MKKETVGRLFTRREVFSLDSNDLKTPEGRARLHIWGGPQCDFETLTLKRIEKEAWDVLHAAGLTDEKLLQEVSRITTALDPGEGKALAMLPIKTWVIDAAMRLTRDEIDEPKWYAANWLNAIEWIRSARDTNPEEALQLAFALGGSYHKAAIQFSEFKWEELAISGQKRRETMNLARTTHNQIRHEKAVKRHAKWCKAARKIWSKHPTWGAPTVAGLIATKKQNPDYIRQIISPCRPPKK